MGFIKSRFSSPEHKSFFAKLEELSLFHLRMCLESVDFLSLSPSYLTTACLTTALQQLKRSPIHGHLITDAGFAEAYKYSIFLGNCLNRQEEIEMLNKKIVEFSRIFDKWHAGMNQLKRFKNLSFALK